METETCTLPTYDLRLLKKTGGKLADRLWEMEQILNCDQRHKRTFLVLADFLRHAAKLAETLEYLAICGECLGSDETMLAALLNLNFALARVERKSDLAGVAVELRGPWRREVKKLRKDFLAYLQRLHPQAPTWNGVDLTALGSWKTSLQRLRGSWDYHRCGYGPNEVPQFNVLCELDDEGQVKYGTEKEVFEADQRLLALYAAARLSRLANRLVAEMAPWSAWCFTALEADAAAAFNSQLIESVWRKELHYGATDCSQGHSTAGPGTAVDGTERRPDGENQAATAGVG